MKIYLKSQLISVPVTKYQLISFPSVNGLRSLRHRQCHVSRSPQFLYLVRLQVFLFLFSTVP